MDLPPRCECLYGDTVDVRQIRYVEKKDPRKVVCLGIYIENKPNDGTYVCMTKEQAINLMSAIGREVNKMEVLSEE